MGKKSYQARLIRWRKFVEQFVERGIDGFLMRNAERRKIYRYPKALIVTLVKAGANG
jgi:hypothetical protein